MEWTVLRGGYFMNNLAHMFAASVITNSSIAFPNIVTPPVDTRDIGRCAAALCLTPTAEHHGRFYECSGPEIHRVEGIQHPG